MFLRRKKLDENNPIRGSLFEVRSFLTGRICGRWHRFCRVDSVLRRRPLRHLANLADPTAYDTGAGNANRHLACRIAR